MRPTVLCVDDDGKEHQEYQRELGQIYNLIAADSSKEAREKLKDQTIDAILMDFQLGKENGCLVTDELKKEGFTQPVLIVSRDYPGDTIANLARSDYGAYGFVIKDPKIYKPILETMILSIHKS
ncbi:response regulator [Candidatus Woesearchaeota archaeon]|nr:response regulator [Candidatus Woesearchaeota archaeon]